MFCMNQCVFKGLLRHKNLLTHWSNHEGINNSFYLILLKKKGNLSGMLYCICVCLHIKHVSKKKNKKNTECFA